MEVFRNKKNRRSAINFPKDPLGNSFARVELDENHMFCLPYDESVYSIGSEPLTIEAYTNDGTLYTIDVSFAEEEYLVTPYTMVEDELCSFYIPVDFFKN